MTRLESKIHIENKIQELRALRGLTQVELADQLQVTRATVIALEKGSYNPSLELAFRISNFFQIPIENIFYIKGAKK